MHATDNREGKLLQQCNILQRRVDSWVKMQELYMPTLAGLRLKERSASGETVVAPDSFKLWLPSQIGRTAPCDSHLQRLEWRLRYAQAHDALRSLRSGLRAQTAILKYKDRNLRGQGANTRARNTLKGIESRIKTAADRYERAHRALVLLSPFLKETSWHSSLRPLNKEDIRFMSDVLWGETEGSRKLSWIWNMRGAATDELDKDGSLEGIFFQYESSVLCLH
jgi:hypothetical protein